MQLHTVQAELPIGGKTKDIGTFVVLVVVVVEEE